MMPFENWKPLTTGGKYKALPWWQGYNKLKHSRIKNIEQATLANAINSLCGLHQVIAKLPELAAATVRHGWFPTHGICQDGIFYTTDIEKLLMNYPKECEGYLVESKLFIVPAGTTVFPDDINSLNPYRYYRSPRLGSFLGRGWW